MAVVFNKNAFLNFPGSPSLDAVFCYSCSQFLTHGTKENVFTNIGFKNWITTPEKSKGLLKHADSRDHITALAIWREKELRESSQIEVSTLICADVLEKNRTYIRSIAEIVQFLAVNELDLQLIISQSIENITMFTITSKRNYRVPA